MPSKRHHSYFKLDRHTKEFMQKMLFSDYLNQGMEDDPVDLVGFLHKRIVNDLKYYINKEEYEMACLLHDIIEKFEERLDEY